MGYNKYYSYNVQGGSAEFPATFAKVMRNVYVWMACGLALTALVALTVVKNVDIMTALLTSRSLIWILCIAEIGLVLWLTARIDSMSSTTAGIMFAVYAILNGVTMSFIFLVYTTESIATTFFITAGTFAVMSIIGYTIRKDLSGIGRILIMLLIGLVIATVVNIFVKSSGLAVLLSYVGVLIFVGLTAYDTQKIKVMVQNACMDGNEEQTTKLALMGSLSLYLDFINLFLMLLRIFGSRR